MHRDDRRLPGDAGERELRHAGQPRSVSWYGNGLLWAGLTADGVYSVPPDHVGADGSIGNKLLWVTTPPAERADGLG